MVSKRDLGAVVPIRPMNERALGLSGFGQVEASGARAIHLLAFSGQCHSATLFTSLNSPFGRRPRSFPVWL
jgi:CII-binding regulator of phage lambda lysogenization HflD